MKGGSNRTRREAFLAGGQPDSKPIEISPPWLQVRAAGATHAAGRSRLMSLMQQGGPSPPDQQAGRGDVFPGWPQVKSLSGLVRTALCLQQGHWASPPSSAGGDKCLQQRPLKLMNLLGAFGVDHKKLSEIWLTSLPSRSKYFKGEG